MLFGLDFVAIRELLIGDNGELSAGDGVFFANLLGRKPTRPEPLEAVPEPPCSTIRRYDFGFWSP